MGRIVLPLEDLYLPIARDIAQVRRVFDDRLFSEFPHVNFLCEHVRQYRGKMLRPALLLLAARAIGEPTDEHITLAVVVEMVHVATLVHDDVLDEAETRRKLRTVNRTNGNESAVLLGDYLFSHAFHLCSTLDSQYASCRIGETTNTVCEGELMQIHHRGDCKLTEAQYFEIIRRKTAALTEVCCELGARFAGASDETVESIRAFGLDVGIAFQITDDVLDLVGAESQIGKTLGRDLDLGKPTLPTIHCLANAEAAVAAELASVLGNGSAGGRRDVRKWLSNSGSVEYAMRQAGEHVERAMARLECLPASPAKDSLAHLAQFILSRQN